MKIVGIVFFSCGIVFFSACLVHYTIQIIKDRKARKESYEKWLKVFKEKEPMLYKQLYDE